MVLKTKSNFDNLPDTGFIRPGQLVPDVVPFSAPTLWRKIKLGTFPKPTKLSERVTAFKVGDVRAWLKSQSEL